MNLSFTKNKKGFTLLEMIVSLGIFSVVAVIAVGSLVRITSLNRQAQAMQSTMNNVNYVLESISREMRTGTHFHCLAGNSYAVNGSLVQKECKDDLNKGKGDKAILFESSKTAIPSSGVGEPCQLIYSYWFKKQNGNPNYWDIRKYQQKNCEDKILSFGDATPLFDDKSIIVTNADFDIVSGGNNYSWATIRFAGYAGTKEKEKNNFDIRTGVSQRIKDQIENP